MGGTESRATIRGEPVLVQLTTEPDRIFQMGTYFGTCLQFGACNQMSVIANAHDANKQVIFVYNAAGNVIARQLVAISKDLGLLGFHCYLVSAAQDEAYRDACLAEVAAFCGRLARQMGAELADEGSPEEIGTHFWYDDGTYPWHPAARRAQDTESMRRSCHLAD